MNHIRQKPEAGGGEQDDEAGAEEIAERSQLEVRRRDHSDDAHERHHRPTHVLLQAEKAVTCLFNVIFNCEREIEP